MLGDHNFTFYLASYYGYRSYHLAYLNQRRRLQYYAHLFSESDAYYYPTESSLYLSLRSRIGGDFALIYPFSRSTRAEVSLSAFHQEEDSDLFYYGLDLPYGQFFNGFALPLEASLTSETTRFSYYGPNSGHTFRLSVGKYFKLFSKSLDAYTLEGGRPQVRAPRQLLPARLPPERLLLRRRQRPAAIGPAATTPCAPSISAAWPATRASSSTPRCASPWSMPP